MNRKTSLMAMAFIALAAFAGTALAHPDFAAAVWHVVTSHADLGVGAMLAWSPLVRSLESQRSAAVDSMKAVVAGAEAEKRDLNESEKLDFDTHKATAEGLKGRIARLQETELLEAGLNAGDAALAAAQMALPNDGRSVTVPATSIIRVEENIEKDPKRGFASFGEYAKAVHGSWAVTRTGGTVDKRLLMLPGGRHAVAPSTYGNEGTGADGGFLVPSGFSQNVFTLSLAEDSLLPLTDNMIVEGNGMQIPKDETTPWGANGVRAYWQGEATAGTATKPVVSMMDLRLKKLLALTPVSDELLADASALTSYLPKKMAVSIRWKTNEAILFGAGAGTPLGAYTALANSLGPVITVAKEAGQATLTLQAINLAKMIARLPPGSFPNAVWIINNDVLPYLFTLTLGNYPIYLPGGAPVAGGIQMNPYGMLLGRPIMVSQHAKSFTNQGDILLVDMSYYQTITKAEGITMASSMHLYFDADAMAFRTTFRVDGQPKIVAPITPANGSNTLSPFVQLATR